jgi:KUP system potassium uptake protein
MNAPAPASTAQIPAQGGAGHPAGPGLMIAALGVVFGDIGTSPLYAFKETMNPEHGVPFSPDSVLGLLSLIFWGLMFVVTLKYVVFVLRADHDGEAASSRCRRWRAARSPGPRPGPGCGTRSACWAWWARPCSMATA